MLKIFIFSDLIQILRVDYETYNNESPLNRNRSFKELCMESTEVLEKTERGGQGSLQESHKMVSKFVSTVYEISYNLA